MNIKCLLWAHVSGAWFPTLGVLTEEVVETRNGGLGGGRWSLLLGDVSSLAPVCDS